MREGSAFRETPAAVGGPHSYCDEGPSSTVLALVDDADLLGTVMVGHDGHRGWVYYLAVSPDCRGQGLGRQLVAAAESWCRDRGVPRVQLMVRASNSSVRISATSTST